jgi:hypothetical protein
MLADLGEIGLVTGWLGTPNVSCLFAGSLLAIKGPLLRQRSTNS